MRIMSRLIAATVPAALLAAARVPALCRDSAGTLWVGTGATLDRYDPGSDTYVHYDHDSDSTFFAGGLIRRLCADRTGALWIAPGSGGAICYDPRTGSHSIVGRAGEGRRRPKVAPWRLRPEAILRGIASS